MSPDNDKADDDPADDNKADDKAPRAKSESHRLFVEPVSLISGPRQLTGEAYHYLCRVRRARVGDRLALFDGQGREAHAVVREIHAERALLEVDEPRAVGDAIGDAIGVASGVASGGDGAGCRVIVASALIKGERMDRLVQKLVELGVSVIAPLLTERTVVRLEGKRAHKRRERFVHIARDAARQSGRARVPEVLPVMDLAAFTSTRAPGELRLIACTSEQERPLRAALPEHAPSSICVLIGPEGGFTPAEVQACQSAGFVSVSLGRYTLRADTAAIALVAALKFTYAALGD